MKDLIVFWKSNSGTDPVGALSGCITPSPMTGRRSAVMTGTTLSVGSSVDSWATGANMWSRRHCLFSLHCLFSECLNLPVHIFKENLLLSTTGDNSLSVIRKTLFLLCLGQGNYVFVLNVTIFSLGIYCVKVLVFGWKIMLRNIVFFCVFQRCKKHKFYFKE